MFNWPQPASGPKIFLNDVSKYVGFALVQHLIICYICIAFFNSFKVTKKLNRNYYKMKICFCCFRYSAVLQHIQRGIPGELSQLR